MYEKRLIEAYINENGTEPTTGDGLSPEDLIDLKTQKTVRPRAPQLTSIPALLGVFQEEWDSLALEAYTLRQNLTQARQELSNALYQHDAAVRVIARLTKERDEAREALASVNVGSSAQTNGNAMHVDPTPLSDEIKAKIASTQERYAIPELSTAALTFAAYQRHGENDQCPKSGRQAMLSPHMLPELGPSLCNPWAPSFRYIKLETLPWSVGQMVLWMSIRSLRTKSSNL